ncbi:MAG: DAK2 domain-containing protein [Synergistaceae bacterium]|jgi:dihydroxyacetone kinase-like protein|nr:DAK2 domain-containing protein [Synergistaceae bacterium]
MLADKTKLDKTLLKTMLLEASRLLREKSDELSELDARFGDGDHGVTIKKIAAVIDQRAAGWGDAGLKAFLTELGDAVMGVSGGAAAPLWGTFIGGLALPLEDEATEIDPPLLIRMFSSALEEMRGITDAKAGDKTLMDALIPAVESMNAECVNAERVNEERVNGAEDSIGKILAAGSSAAEKGAKATENFVARFGRAKNSKERTLGTADPGAVSLSLFFRGLAAGWAGH